MNTIYPYYDLIPYKFSYDSESKEIAIYYDGYFNEDGYVEEKWCFVIKNWESANSKDIYSSRTKSLEDNLGVFSMILGIKIENSILNISVHTLDDRHVDFAFKNADIISYKL